MELSIERTIEFFSGLYNVINNDLNKDGLINKGAPVNEILELTPERLKQECEKQFMKNVFDAYYQNRVVEVDLYNSMYISLEKCLKNEPGKYEEYLIQFPIIKSFMQVIPLYNNMEEFKKYLANM